jgi:hypothetical protein
MPEVSLDPAEKTVEEAPPSIETDAARRLLALAGESPGESKHPATSHNDSKDIGYRAYSRFVAADGNFFIARQYKSLNARIILAMQDDIAELEAELRTKDRALDSVDSFRKVSKERLKILTDLKFRLKEYSKSGSEYLRQTIDN